MRHQKAIGDRTDKARSILVGLSTRMVGLLKKLPPHLIVSRGVKRCSDCNQAFPVDSKPSLSTAFKKHILETHRSATPAGTVRK